MPTERNPLVKKVSSYGSLLHSNLDCSQVQVEKHAHKDTTKDL